MTLRRVTPSTLTQADVGCYALTLPEAPHALCDGPWLITGLQGEPVGNPIVELVALPSYANAATQASASTVLFVTDKRAEADHLMALSHSQAQQSASASASALARIRDRIARRVDAALGSATPTPAPPTSGKPEKSVKARELDALTRANRWLADGNEASERGDTKRAEECYRKSQFWTDRANLLAGWRDRPPPKR